MTNETTASQPKPPSGNRCPCDSSGTCQDVCPDPATGLPLCASADCYSTSAASQPKSIGDDAQFMRLLTDVETSQRWTKQMSDASAKLIAYLDSRAPAAQASAPGSDLPCGQCSANQSLHNVCVDIFPALRNAGHLTLVSLLEVALRDLPVKASATIQAAPDDMPSTMEDARKLIQYLRIEIDSKVMELYDIKKKLAATIQEPVIVAEPVREALEAARYALKHASSLYSCGFNVRHAQSSMNGTDDTGVSASEYEAAAEDIRTAVSKARDLVRTALAAPMVADPAGMVVDAKFWPHGPTQIACSSCGLTAGESRVLDALKRGELAATVKAVPSDLTSIRCPVCCGSGSVDEPGDEAGSCESYGCEECHGQGKIIVDAEDVKAVPSEALELAGMVVKATFGDHKILVPRVDLSGKGIGTLVYFAAPLADKTGGGE